MRTLPAIASAAISRAYTTSDVELRLAAVASTWGTLWLFFPYFDDLKIDWSSALGPALRQAARATSIEALHEVVSVLVAGLRDDHARVSHPSHPIDGVLPLAFRLFGTHLIVVGGLADYLSMVPAGSEVISVENVPAVKQYERVRAWVSAATPGWLEYATAFYLSVGRAGSFKALSFRTPSGGTLNLGIPLVSRDTYDSQVREIRPASGTELEAGIVYVDFEGFRSEAWKSLLPKLTHARAIIVDLRGYTTRAGVLALGHLSDTDLLSPIWQTPLVGGADAETHEVSSWVISPRSPRLIAPVITLIDGRSASTVETMLQVMQENSLCRFVGEPSGGTNGNANSFTIPGDFVVRFTGMRASSRTGSTIQGRGITPDVLVHPTLAGVVSGRDEVLEAGVREALRLAM